MSIFTKRISHTYLCIRRPINTYHQNVEDPKRPDNEHGYVATSFGDSGSPYWMEDDDTRKSTLVAIHRGDIINENKSRGWYDNDPLWQCRTIATKVTKEMVDWIEEKEAKESKSRR